MKYVRQLLLVFLQVAFLILFSTYSYSQEGAQTSNLNGIYSCVVKSKSFSKPRLTQIFIYEYVKSGNNSRFFCQIKQFAGKKASDNFKTTYYIANSRSTDGNSFMIKSIVNLDYKGNTHEIKELKILPNQEIDITSLDFHNTSNTITGIYMKESGDSADFEEFLGTVYSKLQERTQKVGQQTDEVVWGTKIANSGKRYNSVKQNGIKLSSEVTHLADFRDLSQIRMNYVYQNMNSVNSTINDISQSLPTLLKYKYQSQIDPLIYHFPNLKEILVENKTTGVTTHRILVDRGLNSFNFDVELTSEGLKEREMEEEKIASIAQAKKNREEAIANEAKLSKEKKDKSDAEKAIFNPSGVVLKLDGSSKGTRNEVNNFLFGKELTQLFQQYSNSVVKEFEDKGAINSIDTEAYFKNVFYGEFNKLKPELVSNNLFGSKDYFPEFHNAFIFYAYKKFGKSYFPNMVLKEFEILTTETRTNNFGNKDVTEILTPYEIYLPISHLEKFNQYLSKDQFSRSGEDFLVEFEYLILSFLDTYSADSLAFAQMMKNLYNYSNGLPPVSKKDQLDHL
ncbi:hypothetical protein SYJ56_24860 [Algoriphagus sp. D3-2-R+10]|uniref:hypothetical protein n=1 Tax=Algoriphagus aurantiacus TaxID=3103948 RepID=UPI002B3B2252|nr:hypothetical protein [Algoriphagus sp. D3-2-R+10]MEB2778563.1 hypothetical protein [Algoriphagus sp. D3-2-R+10]